MLRRKKILLLPEFGSFGGTRSYFKYLLKFYSSQNYDVTVALPKCNLDDEIEKLLNHYDYRYYKISSRDGKFKRFLCYFPLNLFFDIASIVPIYLKEKPDTIAVSIGTPGMYIGLMILPVKFIYTFHTYPIKSKIFFLRHIQKIFVNLFLNREKIIITVSQYSKEQILNFWVPEKKNNYIKVIYNSTIKSVLIEGNNHKNGSNHNILTLGHVTWYKNPKQWIEIAQEVIRQIPDVNIEFIWAGDGDLLDECKDLVKQAENIKFVGYQEDVDRLYQDSIIYFQPSLLESHGISVVEAMAHGLPCVTSNIGGLPESVIDGETGFTCPPENIACFVSKILKLIDDDKLRYNMGKSGKIRVKEHFSEEVQERIMIDLYNSLLNN